MSAYEAVFCGGPRDGHTAALPDLLRIYRFPVPPSHTLTYTTDREADTIVEPLQTDVYELALAYGWPSRDDAGRYRYEYRGTR